MIKNDHFIFRPLFEPHYCPFSTAVSLCLLPREDERRSVGIATIDASIDFGFQLFISSIMTVALTKDECFLSAVAKHVCFIAT